MIIRDAQFLSAHFSLISWLSIPFSNIVLKIYSNANLTYFGKSVCLQKNRAILYHGNKTL